MKTAAANLTQTAAALSVSAKRMVEAMDEFVRAMTFVLSSFDHDSRIVGVCAPKDYE